MRVCALLCYGLLLFPAWGAQELDVRVQDHTFGQISVPDLVAVVKVSSQELWRNCPDLKISGIDVYRRTDHPETNSKRVNGRILIGLSAHDTNLAQYAFQMGHEFCHSIANFADNRREDRYPIQANFWLEECLCETASLYTLRGLSKSWKAITPHREWQSYSPWFEAYYQDRIKDPKNQLPKNITFHEWFQSQEFKLRLDPTLRDKNTIIAKQLLPIFEQNPEAWECVAYLNSETSAPSETLTQHFLKWQKRCPARLQPCVVKLAEVFEIHL